MAILWFSIEDDSDAADILRRGEVDRDTRDLSDSPGWDYTTAEAMIRAMVADWDGWVGDCLLYTVDTDTMTVEIRGVAFPDQPYDTFQLDDWLIELDRLGLRVHQEAS